MKNWLILSALLILQFPIKTYACLHFDQKFNGSLEEGTKHILLFHDGKNAHMVIRTDIRSTTGSLPPEIAWVLPLPALPVKYEEIEPAVFNDLLTITRADLFKKSKSATRSVLGMEGAAGSAVKSSVQIHELKQIGNYKIQPIELLTNNSEKDLNTWLEKNHFNTMPTDLQKPYLKKGASFLAIRAQLHSDAIQLKPIHIVYPSDTLMFPFKFTHDSRSYSAQIFILSKIPLSYDYLQKQFDTHYFNVGYGFGSLKESAALAPALSQFLKGKTKATELVSIRAENLNGSEAMQLRKLKADPEISSADLLAMKR